MVQPSVRVAISSDFLDAFAQIPKDQQGKVRRFIEQFKANPASPGINYEKIGTFKDQKLRSVRIDQSYRGIVMKPGSGDIYTLLWVAHHDDAYQWAQNKVCNIHPDTGALQVYETQEVQAPTDGGATPGDDEIDPLDGRTDLFAEHRDRELARLGVPLELMPLVRSIKSEEELDRVQPYLPQESYEVLFLLAAGYTLVEVDREMARHRPAPTEEVDTEDFEAALEHPDSQRRFQVLDDDLELQRMLNAPLEKWRVFLHPSQQRIVRMDANGPVRVLGGAGTGKTVVAMHRAKFLAERVLQGPDERLLFTTFTRNLAADIEENLSEICSKEVQRRIEVVNLDRWVNDFLKRQGYEYQVDYGVRTRELWETALLAIPEAADFPRAFYREEWEQVIQPHEVQSLAEYMRVARVGRGTPMSRSQRKLIWPVFQEYQALLNENGLREPDGAMRDARAILENRGGIGLYRSIVVDEAQDLGRQAFKLLRAMVSEQPNDLFIVGDAHQRIYRQPIVLGRCGVDIVGRGRRLRINYRTTEETRRWAVALLEGIPFDDLDGGDETQADHTSLLRGADPEVRHFDSFAEEVDYLCSYLEALDEDDRNRTCLVARTKQWVERYQGALQARGIATYPVRRSEAEDRTAEGVRLATMHRVKGLEFDRVLVVAVNHDVLPLPRALEGAASDADREALETRERSLLYVAATRARREVKVTSHGRPSRFLEG